MGGGVALLLFTAIGGFWVIERALNHKGQLKKFGMFLGSLIILMSLLGALGQMAMICSWKKQHGFGMMGKGSCPFTGSAAQSPAKP